jgi:hypothetical protein
MAIKLNRTFRKKKLLEFGERVGSIKRMSKYDTRLYTFSYVSRGTNPKKPRQNKDRQPLLLIAYSRNKKRFFNISGKRFAYVWGFNLNYLPASKTLRILKELRDKYNDFNDEPVDYNNLRKVLDLPTSKEDTIFRKYRTGGGNLNGLIAIDLDTYIEELSSKISSKSRR